MNLLKINEKTYYRLHFLSLTTGSLVLLALWSFFEASIWFVLPDFFLLILCILAPEKYKRFFVIGFLFSIIGVTFYFFFVATYQNLANELLINTPFVNQEMLDTIDKLYETKGLTAVFRQTTTIIPVKVWTFQAVLHNFSFIPYLLIIALIRSIRMFLVCLIFSFIGKKFKANIRSNVGIFIILYVVLFFFVLFYIT